VRGVSVPRQKRVFTPEYRADAVTLVLSGDRPIASIARDLGIGEWTPGNWVATSRKNGSAASAERPLDLNERAELKRLREELRVARMERDFLKKRRPVQGVRCPAFLGQWIQSFHLDERPGRESSKEGVQSGVP